MTGKYCFHCCCIVLYADNQLCVIHKLMKVSYNRFLAYNNTLVYNLIVNADFFWTLCKTVRLFVCMFLGLLVRRSVRLHTCLSDHMQFIAKWLYLLTQNLMKMLEGVEGGLFSVHAKAVCKVSVTECNHNHNQFLK